MLEHCIFSFFLSLLKTQDRDPAVVSNGEITSIGSSTEAETLGTGAVWMTAATKREGRRWIEIFTVDTEHHVATSGYIVGRVSRAS